ncbi:hypothetical protein Vafri_101, partial [Volvox africanus]
LMNIMRIVRPVWDRLCVFIRSLDVLKDTASLTTQGPYLSPRSSSRFGRRVPACALLLPAPPPPAARLRLLPPPPPPPSSAPPPRLSYSLGSHGRPRGGMRCGRISSSPSAASAASAAAVASMAASPPPPPPPPAQVPPEMPSRWVLLAPWRTTELLLGW